MADVNELIRFLGLADAVDPTSHSASFPLGVLYPYTADLLRVCERFARVSETYPAAAPMLLGNDAAGPAEADQPGLGEALAGYLSSIKTLQGRIAFAPGTAGDSVGQAYRQVDAATRR